MQSTRPALWLSAMGHSRMRNVIWEELTEKFGGKIKYSWCQLCKNACLESMTWEHKQLSVEILCQEM